MFTEGDAGDVKSVALEPLFLLPLQAHTGSSRLRSASSKAGVGFHIALTRGPPLWVECDAQVDDRVQNEPDWATHH
jgi:hypothetical protein